MQTFRITRNAAAAVAAIICLAAAPQDVFSASVKKPQQSTGLAAPAAAGVTHDLVDLDGPGVFVSAFMTKQGGVTDITSVVLIIDGQTVVARNIAALKNFRLTQNNSYGVSVFASPTAAGIDAVTIGFSEPLKFKEFLLLRAIVGASDNGVVQILGTVIHGTSG